MRLVFVALRSLLGRLAYSFHHSMSQDFAQRRVPPFSYEQPRSRVAYESVHLEQLSGAPFPPPTHHFAIGKGRSQGGSLVDAVRRHMRAIVYGGTDGIITIFAIVAGVSGATLSNKILMIIGVATLFADALSMSVSDYMSSSAETEIEQRLKKEQEMNYDLDRSEMLEQLKIYFIRKGFSADEAIALSQTIGKNKETTIELIQALDKHEEEEEASPMSSAIYTFLSFVFFGMIPLIADVMFISLMKDYVDPPLFLLTAIVTALTLALLGGLKAVMAKRNPIQGALLMVVVGGVASFISWFIAAQLSESEEGGDLPPPPPA